MKTKYFQCVAAAFGAMTASAVAADTNHAAIPFNQIGAAAAKQYSGDGLSIVQDAGGATLRCVFQKMEGHVTREGLWLTSTAALDSSTCLNPNPSLNSAAPEPAAEAGRNPPFRIIAESVGREDGPTTTLQKTGEVGIGSRTARFHRAGLDEEYTVSVEGVRRDFVLTSRPAGNGALLVELKVDGARAEAIPDGARLVLSGSGRRLAYNRLRATDANGRELSAKMEVRSKSEIRNQKLPWL